MWGDLGCSVPCRAPARSVAATSCQNTKSMKRAPGYSQPEWRRCLWQMWRSCTGVERQQGSKSLKKKSHRICVLMTHGVGTKMARWPILRRCLNFSAFAGEVKQGSIKVVWTSLSSRLVRPGSYPAYRNTTHWDEKPFAKFRWTSWQP